MKPTIQLNGMTADQSAQFIGTIDWKRLIPLVIQLVRQLQSGNPWENWEELLRIITEIISIITQAQDQCGVQFDWSQLIELLIRYLLPIIIGGNKQP